MEDRPNSKHMKAVPETAQYCPYCGKKHPIEAAFCPTTGQSLLGVKKCPHCGQIHPPNNKVCPQTGQELPWQPKPVKDKRNLRSWGILSVLLLILIGVIGLWSIRNKQIEKLPQLPSNNSISTFIPTQQNVTTQDSSYEPSWIAFEEWDRPKNDTDDMHIELWLVRSDGSELHRITKDSHDRGPAWSPNRRYIAFSRIDLGIKEFLLLT